MITDNNRLQCILVTVKAHIPKQCPTLPTNVSYKKHTHVPDTRQDKLCGLSILQFQNLTLVFFFILDSKKGT